MKITEKNIKIGFTFIKLELDKEEDSLEVLNLIEREALESKFKMSMIVKVNGVDTDLPGFGLITFHDSIDWGKFEEAWMLRGLLE